MVRVPACPLIYIVKSSLREGVGGGLQKITLPVRLYIDFAKNVGQAGTFGLGKNAITEIHVKDVASAIIVMLKAALEGKADEGADGFCECSFKLYFPDEN